MTENRMGTTLLLGLAASVLLVDVLTAVEAQAAFGARRRTAIVTAAVVHDQDEKAAQKQQAAASEQPAAEAKPAEAPEQEAKPAAQPQEAKPVGTVVRALPDGCQETTVGGVAYQKCGPDYYRAAFQGSDLVYVTAKP